LISGTVFAAFPCQMIRRALEELTVYSASDDNRSRIVVVLRPGVVVAATVNCTYSSDKLFRGELPHGRYLFGMVISR